MTLENRDFSEGCTKRVTEQRDPGRPLTAFKMGRRELKGQGCLSFEAEPRQGFEASGLFREWAQKAQVDEWRSETGKWREPTQVALSKQVTTAGPGVSGGQRGACLRVIPPEGWGSWSIFQLVGWELLPGHEQAGTAGLPQAVSKGSGDPGQGRTLGKWAPNTPTCANTLCWKLIMSDSWMEFNSPLSKV